MLKPSDFFDLEGFEFRALFDGVEYVWAALNRVGPFALEYIMSVDGDSTIFGTVMDGAWVDDAAAVVIGEGTVVEPGAFIQGPAIIGRNCQIRNGAYIRGDVVIGNNCIVEAGLYVTAGSKVTLPDGTIAKAKAVSGADNLLFRRNSQSGAIEVVQRSGTWGGLNAALHATD